MVISSQGAEIVAPSLPSLLTDDYHQYYGCHVSAQTALVRVHLGSLSYDRDAPSPLVDGEFYISLETPLHVADDWDKIQRWAETVFPGHVFLGYYNATAKSCPIEGYEQPF